MCDTLFNWRRIPVIRLEQFYMLILIKRFDKEKLKDWKLDWYNAFQSYAKDHFEICTICGLPKIGRMCNDKDWNWKHPIYIRFEAKKL